MILILYQTPESKKVLKSTPITYLINLSLQVGSFPNCIKIVFVTRLIAKTLYYIIHFRSQRHFPNYGECTCYADKEGLSNANHLHNEASILTKRRFLKFIQLIVARLSPLSSLICLPHLMLLITQSCLFGCQIDSA